MTTRLPDIRTLNWQPKLGAPGEVVTEYADIDQALRIIVTTPKGSDPLRPTFGADALHYLDMPENQATAPLIAEVALAILAWEPRIQLIAVKPFFDTANPGRVVLDIEWAFRGIEASRITSFRIPS